MFALTFGIWAAIAAGTTFGMGLVFKKEKKVRSSIAMFVLFYALSWIILPPLALDLLGTWAYFLSILVISAVIAINQSEDKDNDLSIMALVAIYLLVMVVGMVATSGVFMAQDMASVITLRDHGQKDSTIELVSQSQAQRVTPGLALKRAAELIGASQQKGLASVAKYGAMYGNVTSEGNAVWVAPLEPSGFWRWVSSPVTPGYFISSHVNNMDSRLVEDQPIAYGITGFYFGKDLHRHLYINGYVNYSYGDAFFQIDDSGTPYYVVPMERPQVGFWSKFPERWAVVNATTGEITDVKNSDDLPQWVDRAYSQSIMQKRLKDWGCYSPGWWACFFSGVEVIDPTPGVTVTMNDTGNMIYYTGTQFRNNKVEGATSGVVTINTRTGHVDFYRRAGITEKAAVDIINGAVANFTGRDAEDPVLIQVNGLETYFAVITDASGAKKGYGMVWQRNRDVYGIGDTVVDATRAYLRSVRENKNLTAFEGASSIDPDVFEGLVITITPVVRDGETAFYLRIDTVDDKVFIVNTDTPAEVATTSVGEPVRVTTFNSEPGTVEVDHFDNLLINLLESEGQRNLTSETEEVMIRYKEQHQKQDAAAQIGNLTPSQVREVLKLLKK